MFEPLLAVQPDGQIALFQSLLLFGGLLLVLALGFVVVIYLRRRLKEDRADAGGALTLDDVCALRDSGRITADEYETLRRKAVERLTDNVEQTAGR